MASDLHARLGGARSSLAFKAPCRVATTANITLSGTQTIDGVAVVAEDRVLVKSQTDSVANGIYVVKATAWERAKDFDGSDDVVDGTRVYVHSGSTASGSYVVTTDDPIVIDTSTITFATAATVDLPNVVSAASTFGVDNILLRSDEANRGAQATGITVDDSNNMTGLGALGLSSQIDLSEMTAPSAPSANIARLYAVDSQSRTVPFWKDSAGLASALDIRTGWVQMYRTSDAGADPSTSPATWVVRAPDGSYVSTSGTTTQGAQEALTYCATYGYNLFINGGGGINSSDIDVATIHSTSGIDIPPLFKQAVVARGGTFNFGGSATYGFKVDSMMMSLLDFRSCQIVVGTTTYEYGVWLRPRTANAVDPTTAITASDLLFGSIVHGKSTSTGLLVDTTDGPILDGVFIEVHEPNGKGASGSDTAAYGVRILDSATNVVKGTTMRILDAHGHGTASVAIGSSTTNGANIHSNHFDIHCDPGASAIGIDLYGAYNSIIARINDDEGTATTGINIRSSAVYNHIIAPRIEATTKFADASAGFTNLIDNEGYRYGGNLFIGTLSSISTVAGSGGAVASRLQFHSTGADSAVTTWRWSNDTAGARVILSKSRGTSVGTHTVVASGDVLGELVFAGADGTDMEPAAAIRVEVDNTPGAGDMPGRLVFSTTADGAEAVTDRLILDSTGILKPNTNDGVALGTGALSFSDLFLATGGVINWNNGDVLATHSANTLAFTGASSGYTHDALVSATQFVPSGSTIATNGMYLPTTNTLGFSLNSLDVLRLEPTASAVNYAYIKGAATGGGGNRVTFGAKGSDTDVSIDFIAKGAGDINFNARGSNAGAIARYVSGTASNANGVMLTSAGSGSGPTIASADLGGTGNSNIDLNINATGTGAVSSTHAIKALNATAIPAGGTAAAGFMFSSTANFGVFFGSGAPSLSAAKGSLYLRSDGSSTSTRAYINTDGSTAWTAVTTAA